MANEAKSSALAPNSIKRGRHTEYNNLRLDINSYFHPAGAWSNNGSAIDTGVGQYDFWELPNSVTSSIRISGHLLLNAPKVYVVLYASTTEDYVYNVKTDGGAIDQAYNAISGSISSTVVGLTALNLTLIDVSAAFQFLVGEQYFGLVFEREGSHGSDGGDDLDIIGLLVEY